MGLNTAALILNDRLHELREDPNLGGKITTAINAGPDRAPYLPGLTLLRTAHADTIQIIAVGGNSIRALGYGHYRDDDETLLRKLADHLGFYIRRKPAPSSAKPTASENSRDEQNTPSKLEGEG